MLPYQVEGVAHGHSSRQWGVSSLFAQVPHKDVCCTAQAAQMVANHAVSIGCVALLQADWSIWRICDAGCRWADKSEILAALQCSFETHGTSDTGTSAP